MRTLKDYSLITLKGMAMGAADVVPGVSGGTIALISGIYKELINTLTSLDFTAIHTLRKQGVSAAFNAINGKFLVALVLGILISILSLAKLFNHLLVHYPILVWSFFFGLILASVWLIGRRVSSWNLSNITVLIIGTIISLGITMVSPANGPDAIWFLFVSGILAFIAMILPGISGSFILLLLGAYQLILSKVSLLLDGIRLMDTTLILTNALDLGSFAAGGVLGLLGFSRMLKWMFEKYESRTLALLTGFLLGSLNKVWPWKFIDKVFITHSGMANEKIVPLVERNVMPNTHYTHITENDLLIGLIDKSPQIIPAIALCLLGIIMIIGLERIAHKKS